MAEGGSAENPVKVNTVLNTLENRKKGEKRPGTALVELRDFGNAKKMGKSARAERRKGRGCILHTAYTWWLRVITRRRELAPQKRPRQ